MLAFRYISWHYLKYFFIILTALVFFVVGFDYMGSAQQLSKSSANLILIYLVYKSFFAIDILLPVSLVFAMISTKIYLIRSNALVSFFSLGYSRVDVLRPFVFVSTVIIMLFITLHNWSNFARSEEFSKNIKKNSQYLSPTRDLFFVYKGKYIYFSKLLPLQESAKNIRVFTICNESLKEVIIAKSARYIDNYWFIEKADIIKKPDDLSISSPGIKVSKVKNLKILEGFRPKMLDQVYEGKVNFTITDAIDAIRLLDKQHVNTDNIKSALYKIFIYPFFVPCLIVIIFFFVPMSVRFLNISLFTFGAILATLLTWGILFFLIKLSNNKVISSEIGIVLPVAILAVLAFIQWYRHRYSTT